jgi:hypothetical protein
MSIWSYTKPDRLTIGIDLSLFPHSNPVRPTCKDLVVIAFSYKPRCQIVVSAYQADMRGWASEQSMVCLTVSVEGARYRLLLLLIELLASLCDMKLMNP